MAGRIGKSLEIASPTSSVLTASSREMDQLGFALPVQTTTFGTFSWETSNESHLQILLHKPLFDTNHGTATDGEDISNLPIGCLWFIPALITHQQNSGNQRMPVWRTAHGDHLLQK